ncbi:retropepsin-like aspartic protease family protein [Marinobacterium arenosum]|uniref:retropepsin-like aspartic protease family protein n=1 Tax=Marinobacterium arenosum TaxID=2862496 RepID=UPI001C960E13|nr:retropepsin-like aspartic protease [Marinobacterium arenosum]MBY4677613.1 retroviral-like aspartic protease family protein [Marinobacterium arenosum]
MNDPQHDDDLKPIHIRLGRLFSVLFWILLFGLLVLFFNFRQEQQQNPNRHLNQTSPTGQPLNEVVLERNRAGHYVAPGRINGQPVTFLIDTGATHVSIPGPVANRLMLHRGTPMLAHTANGTVKVYATRLESIELGGLLLHSIAASINPHMTGDTILLGMSFMKHLELEQRDGTLTLRLPL